MKYLEQIKKNFPFEKPRQNQFEYINYMLEHLVDKDENYFLLESPTGTGKSVIGYTIGKTIDEIRKKENITTISETGDEISGPKVLILTSTRVLQKQYSDTFKEFGVEYIWSASNYECDIYPPEAGVYYGSPGCLREMCHRYSDCKYVKQRAKFKSAQIGVTNYNYFVANCKLNTNFLICDEAHNIPSILYSSAELKFTNKSFEYLFNICNKIEDIPFDLDEKNLVNWFNQLVKYTFEEIESIECLKFSNYFKDILVKNNKLLEDYSNDLYDEITKEYKDRMHELSDDYKTKIIRLGRVQTYFHNMLDRLNAFNENPNEWVVSSLINKPGESLLIVKPLKIHSQFSDITKKTNKILMMSATICGGEEFKKEIGLSDNCPYLETPSLFPVQNRRVFAWNAGNFNFKTKDSILPHFTIICDHIIKMMTNDFTKPQNGIIHSVSYANAEFIKNNSKYSNKLFIPTKDELLELNNILEKNKDKGIVIISPTILEGIDLIDDLSRFQIFIKTPYASLGDRWVKRKLDENPKWYSRDTIIKIVQGTGRSIRSETDWAYTFVLDSNFNKLVFNNNELIPRWFLESIQWNNTQK